MKGVIRYAVKVDADLINYRANMLQNSIFGVPACRTSRRRITNDATSRDVHEPAPGGQHGRTDLERVIAGLRRACR